MQKLKCRGKVCWDKVEELGKNQQKIGNKVKYLCQEVKNHFLVKNRL